MKIVADSSCDLNEDLRARLGVELVPLSIDVGDQHFVDDDQLNVTALMDTIEKSKVVAKSACPSPQDFMQAFKDQGSVFVVTLTSALSGTYDSAVLAKQLFMEEFGEKFIHIFDSKGASVRETLIAMKLKELINNKLNESEIVSQVNAYISKQRFYFQLGSLDTMIKNGRIPKLKGIIANALQIKPILCASETGEVELYQNMRSEKKSINKFIEIIKEQCDDASERVLGIAHCEAYEKAMTLKAEIEAHFDFKEIIVVPTKGLSSIYSSRGGILLAF